MFSLRIRLPLLTATLLTAAFGIAGAAPVIPGLHNKHPLNEHQVGTVLINELRCTACHVGKPNNELKAAPDLTQVGTRLNSDYLRRFIADPSGTHPGTTMPDVLTTIPAGEREKVAESISHYLLSLKGDLPAHKPKPEPATGRELFHSIGCVACHSPRDEAGKELSTAGVVSLSHLAGKHQAGALADFLHDPLKIRPSGRMPDMNLERAEANALAAYLEGKVSSTPIPKPTPQQILEGKRYFKELNCAACHQMEDKDFPAVISGPSFDRLDPTNGCLSAKPTKVPNFHLDAAQRKAIQAALQAPNAQTTPADQIKLRLTQLNCIACHERDDYGGVSADRDAFFHSTEEALGNEARIPPPLTLIGAKLRPEWLNKVLFDRESVRPYMKTRMPQYGESCLEGLPALFAKTDHMKEVALPAPTRETRPKISNGGHMLLGDKGLNCITCHNFNGKESPGMKGMDLMTSYQRLQPSWFYHYMKNPAAFRPGILMPNYWPGDKAVQTEILDGDTELQLQALWHNFSLGRSARNPSGLSSPSTELIVTDKTRTYRGRSGIAGYRGIAVGFPGGLNYAFNAKNGTLSGIWQGGFVNANWRSQAAGDFRPIGRSINLAQDVAFLQLADDKAAWPLRPKTTKENPVNPDPLYPRNHGYAFGGYFFDEASIPTFMYRCGPIAIEDKSVALSADEKLTLRRHFSFTTPTTETVYFRALTGKITAESATVFKTADLQLTIGSANTLLRPFGEKEGEQELLIKLTIPKGSSDYTLDYLPLR